MKQGHRGANHPVKNLETNSVEITSQNHGFIVDKQSLPSDLQITHISLFDQSIEGLKHKNFQFFQFNFIQKRPQDLQIHHIYLINFIIFV